MTFLGWVEFFAERRVHKHRQLIRTAQGMACDRACVSERLCSFFSLAKRCLMWMREVYWRGNGHLKGKIADFKLGIKMTRVCKAGQNVETTAQGTDPVLKAAK